MIAVSDPESGAAQLAGEGDAPVVAVLLACAKLALEGRRVHLRPQRALMFAPPTRFQAALQLFISFKEGAVTGADIAIVAPFGRWVVDAGGRRPDDGA
jgi:hypothetical protein